MCGCTSLDGVILITEGDATVIFVMVVDFVIGLVVGEDRFPPITVADDDNDDDDDDNNDDDDGGASCILLVMSCQGSHIHHACGILASVQVRLLGTMWRNILYFLVENEDEDDPHLPPRRSYKV